jgi:hypothetical protein
MTSLLIYSFRTNKHLEIFRDAGIEVFIFGKLNDDFYTFHKLIDKVRPDHIIGLAEVKLQSRIETHAINAFGRSGKINKTGKELYSLYIPHRTVFPKSKRTTKSFCNWTMYKISEIVATQNTKVTFIHFNQKDIPQVIDFIKSMADIHQDSKDVAIGLI